MAAHDITVAVANARVPRIIVDSKSPHALMSVSPGVFQNYTQKNLWGGGATNINTNMTTIGRVVASHMGVTLYAAQMETLDLIERLIIKTAVGDGIPNKFVIEKKYLVTEQSIAEIGTPDSIGSGTNTKEMVISTPFQGRIITVVFESGILEQTPEQVADVINREFARVDPMWCLTKTFEVLRHCGSQITLTEATAIATNTERNPARRIRDLVAVMDLTCGIMNNNPGSIHNLMSAAIDMALGSAENTVIVMPKSIYKSMTSGLAPTGGLSMESISHHKREFLGFTLADASNCHVVQPRDYNMQYKYITAPEYDTAVEKLAPGAGPDSAQYCQHLVLANGQMIPVIVVDDVSMNSKGSSLQDVLCAKDSIRSEFFTVGATSPALRNISPCVVFEEGGEIDSSKIALRSPDTTSVHCYHDGSVKNVTLRELHTVASHPDIFNATRLNQLQAGVDEIQLTEYTNDQICNMLEARTWAEKMSVAQSQFEVDMKFMVKPFSTAAGTAAEVYNRGCLFNLSPLNDVKSEISQIGSELIQYVQKFQLNEMFDMIKSTLSDIRDHARIATIRNARIAQPAAGTQAAQRPVFEQYLFSDPQCFVNILEYLGSLQGKTEDELTRHTRMLNFFKSILALFGEISPLAVSSIIHHLDPLFGIPAGLVYTDDELLFIKIMHYIVMPILATKVAAPIGNNPTVVQCNNTNTITGEIGTSIAITDGFYCNGVTPRGCQLVTNDVWFMAHKDIEIARTSLFSRMWAYRISQLRHVPTIVGVLVGMHYSLMLSRDNFLHLFDKNYYSGLSYICLRYVRFNSWGFAVMPKQNAIYHCGYTTVTTRQTHDKIISTMFKETGITTEDIRKMGMFVDNVYMSHITGGDLILPDSDVRASPDAIVIVDGFNSYTPNSQITTNNSNPYLFAHGRSDLALDATQPDPLLENMYTTMPTLHATMSAARVRCTKLNNGRGREESNAAIFLKNKMVSDIDDMFRTCREDPRNYYKNKLSQYPTMDKIYNSNNGIVFCATYGIGRFSDSTLMYGSDYKHIIDRLSPRVSGTGIFCGSPLTDIGTAFTAAFSRVLTVGWKHHMQF